MFYYYTLNPTPRPACSNIINNITILPNCVFTVALDEGRRAISITSPTAMPTINSVHPTSSSAHLTWPHPLLPTTTEAMELAVTIVPIREVGLLLAYTEEGVATYTYRNIYSKRISIYGNSLQHSSDS